jgi:hypothetical protein
VLLRTDDDVIAGVLLSRRIALEAANIVNNETPRVLIGVQ